MRVLLTGGGTGGHLSPLLAIAKALQKEADLKKEPLKILYLGPCNNLSDLILKSAGIETRNVMAGKWRRYFSFMNFVDIFRGFFGLLQALVKVLIFMPDVVFSKGGYGSVPVVLAARLFLIPIIIHESDAVPGKANRIMQHFADVIAVSYEMTKGFSDPTKTYFTGSPVRENLLGGDPARAKSMLGIRTEKPILLILGGSQGAKKINEVIGQILNRLVETYEIIHQCGEKNFDETKDLAGKAGIKINRENYHLYPFMRDEKEELKNALACADLVLSRAGASSIAEIAAYGKPSILVPLHGSANDHQIHNAFEVAKAGAAIALREENLTPELLLGKIDILMNDLPLRQMMGEKAKLFYHHESATTIADIVLKLGNKEKLKD